MIESSVRMALHAEPSRHRRGLLTIAVYKFIKAVLLLALGFGELHYLHRDLAHHVAHWVDLLRGDPHNHYLMWLAERLAKVDEHRLRELSVGTFFYAGLFLTEGIGLSLRMRWAEYLTIVSTASLLPIEIYGIVQQASLGKVLVLVGNVVIVAYLVWVVGSERQKHGSKRRSG